MSCEEIEAMLEMNLDEEIREYMGIEKDPLEFDKKNKIKAIRRKREFLHRKARKDNARIAAMRKTDDGFRNEKPIRDRRMLQTAE